jgi:hypothetical protein
MPTTNIFSFKVIRIFLGVLFILFVLGCRNNTQQKNSDASLSVSKKDTTSKAITKPEETPFTKADLEQFKNGADSTIHVFVSKKMSYVLKIDTLRGDSQKTGNRIYFYSDSLQETVVASFGMNRPNIISFELLIYKYASATTASAAMDKITILVLGKMGLADPDSYFFRINNYVLFLKTSIELSGGIHDNLSRTLNRIVSAHHNPIIDTIENHYKSTRIQKISADPISGKWHFVKLMSIHNGDTVKDIALYDSSIEFTDKYIITPSYNFAFSPGWKTIMHGAQNYFGLYFYDWRKHRTPNKELAKYKGDITYYSLSADQRAQYLKPKIKDESLWLQCPIMLSNNELCFIQDRVLYLYKRVK